MTAESQRSSSLCENKDTQEKFFKLSLVSDAGATEMVREVRHGMDGWQNALVGSAISGAFLGRFWGKLVLSL